MRNCNTCAHEYRDPGYPGHKLCRVAWEGRPAKEATVAWILTPDNIIDWGGNCGKKADNCPGWEKR